MEQRVAEYIKETFTGLGLVVKLDEVGNVYLEYEGSCESDVFYYISHIDTVKPFLRPKAVDNVVFGRGAVDAKGPLLAMIDALYEIKSPCIKVYGLVGEELDSRGARHLVNKNIRLSNVVIGEPSNNSICIGYRGRLLMQFTCEGHSRHSASHSTGNPIYSITSVMVTIEKIIDSIGEDKVVANPTRVLSGASTNVVPSRAKVFYDFRFSSFEALDALLEKIKVQIPPECRYKQLSLIPPVEVKPTDILIKALARSITREGLKVNYIRKAGTSDMNVLLPVADHIVSFGPGDPRLSHTSKEKIGIEEIIMASRVLRGLPSEFSAIRKPPQQGD